MRKLVFFLFCIALAACSSEHVRTSVLFQGYQLAQPDRIVQLPDSLNEVSGITVQDTSMVAVVQDENGVVFFYQFLEEKVLNRLEFAGDGDYEGIARNGDTLYVLRSDGVVFEIANYSGAMTVKSMETGVPAKNNEGLYYDQKNHRLLIAAKSNSEKGKENKNNRDIFEFNPRTGILNPEPAFRIKTDEVAELCYSKGIELPEKEKKGGKKKEPESEFIVRFRTSALAIHPISGHLFALSSVDHLLVVISANGQLLDVAKLDAEMFNKPEGIIFLDNGTMFITNEAQDKHPTLLRFKLQ